MRFANDRSRPAGPSADELLAALEPDLRRLLAHAGLSAVTADYLRLRLHRRRGRLGASRQLPPNCPERRLALVLHEIADELEALGDDQRLGREIAARLTNSYPDVFREEPLGRADTNRIACVSAHGSKE